MIACIPRCLAAVGFGLVVTFSNTARAEKDEEPSLYVQPQTGAFLRIEESDKRGVARFAHKTPGGFRLDLTVSAPLDDESREASLANIDGPSPGASARLAFGYDSRRPALKLTLEEVDIASESAMCLVVRNGFKEEACQATEQEFRGWYAEYVAGGRKRVSFTCEPPNPQGAESNAKPGETKPEDAALEKRRKEFRESEKADCLNTEKYLNAHAACPKVGPGNDRCRGVERALGRLDAMTQAEQRRAARELERHAVPNSSAFFYAILFEVSGNYDRISAYSTGDIALPAKDVSSYGVSFGPRLDLYLAPAWAFSASSGGELTRQPAFDTAKRCTTLTSSEDTVTGQSCEDVKVLAEHAESAWSFYAQASGMYLFRDLVDGAVPGTELRMKVSGLGQDAELQTRFTVFLSPVTGPALTRFGVGADLFFPLYDDDESGAESGKLHDISPFLLVGASL